MHVREACSNLPHLVHLVPATSSDGVFSILHCLQCNLSALPTFGHMTLMCSISTSLYMDPFTLTSHVHVHVPSYLARNPDSNVQWNIDYPN